MSIVSNSKSFVMIKSQIKIAGRNLKRTKIQSAISIFGLGIGLGCIILLLALIIHEKSFDRYIPDHQNVYRIIFGDSWNTQYPLAEAMKEEFPEVKDYFRFYQTNVIQLRNPSGQLVSDRFFGFADPSLFRILGIRLLSGTPANSATEVAISESIAVKYFANTSPLGAILSVKLNNEFVDLNISGIYKDFPSTSTLHPEFLANIKLSEKMFEQFQSSLGEFGSETPSVLNWESGGFLSYVLLENNSSPEALAKKISKYKEFITRENIDEINYSLQPVADIYLKSTGSMVSHYCRAGNPEDLKYYEAISLLILLISVTNYIFLTRAATNNRLRDLGTRKVIGASRNILRKQILFESNLITILSLIPAFFVINFGMTFINNTLNKTLGPDVFQNPVTWLLLISVVLFTGTVSGMLIGFKISRIPPLLLLSGRTTEISGSGKWKYSFLIFHFSIYIILVICVLSVSKQIKYSLTNFKGINPRNIIVCDLNSSELQSSFAAICNEIEKVPGVIKTAGSSFIPPFNSFLPVTLANTDGERIRFDGLIMGEGMTELLGIEVNDGSSFGPFNTERREILLNESSALKYNVRAGENFLGFHVLGILKDFHAHSLHRLIQPMVILQQNPNRMGILAIKTDGSNDDAIIKALRALYSQIAPNEIFEPDYLTDQINNFYRNEKEQVRIIGAFSILATVLSIMGLFGIALITSAKRAKEIGLRKVNGATVAEILYLLNTTFIRWVIISALIAIPASIYLISEWQSRFAYKTDISWWIFVTAVLSALLISLITVSWQSWRAATRNPVEALRYE